MAETELDEPDGGAARSEPKRHRSRSSPLKRNRIQDLITGILAGSVSGLIFERLDLSVLASYWGDSAKFVVAAVVIGALGWHVNILRRVCALITVSLMCLWGAVAYTPFIPKLAGPLVRLDTPSVVPAVFVLGSRIQQDGELTAASEARLLRALEFIGQGYAPTLILSELPPDRFPSYAAVARKLIRNLKMDVEVITVGPIENTRQEAAMVAALAKDRGWTRIGLVTSPTHSRRAAATFEKTGLEVISFPATETNLDIERLDEPTDRIRACPMVLHEWVGLVYYQLRGWL